MFLNLKSLFFLRLVYVLLANDISCFFFCSNWLSTCKLVYYRVFSWMYGMVGSCTHLAMVNSSWTKSHIEVLWRIPERITRVYPPCDTSGLQVFESLDFCLSSCYILASV